MFERIIEGSIEANFTLVAVSAAVFAIGLALYLVRRR